MEVQDTKSTLQVTLRKEEIKKIWKSVHTLLVITLVEVIVFTLFYLI